MAEMAKFDPERATFLYAVRHGETEWNVAGIQQGHLDSPLTDAGIQQAKSLAHGLTGRGIQRIFSSDLGRAAHTAEIIASKLGLPITLEPGLRERNLGSMQGLTKTQFRDRFPDEYAAFQTYDPDYQLPGGESARQRCDRSITACNKLLAQHPGETVLIVAHGGVLNSMLTYTLDLGVNAPRRFSLYNGAINRFTITEGNWNLDTWGNVAHLDGKTFRDDS